MCRETVATLLYCLFLAHLDSWGYWQARAAGERRVRARGGNKQQPRSVSEGRGRELLAWLLRERQLGGRRLERRRRESRLGLFGQQRSVAAHGGLGLEGEISRQHVGRAGGGASGVSFAGRRDAVSMLMARR